MHIKIEMIFRSSERLLEELGRLLATVISLTSTLLSLSD